MFNPSDLDGEVDHSFFDSDCDGSGDGGKRVSRSLKAEKKSLPTHEGPQHANKAGGVPMRTDGTKKNEETSRPFSVSSVVSTLHKVIDDYSDNEQASNLHYKKCSRTPTLLSAEAREADDKDVYHDESSSESQQDELPANPKCSGSRERNKRYPQLIGEQRPRSLSPSSEASMDTESDLRCRNLSPLRTEESEDTVTDVSPLSSPDISPLQSPDLNHSEVTDGCLKEHQQESVPSSGLSSIHEDEDSPADEDECSLISEIQHERNMGLRCPWGKNRKNYSFSNEEVRRIDIENQRLLRQLSRTSLSSRPGSTLGKKSHKATNSAPVRVTHSAVNRHREQQRIDRENQALLKRLEAIKPSRGLSRSEQLADYQRHVTYMGAPPSAMYTSTPKNKGTPTENTSGVSTAAGKKNPMQASPALHSARALPITTDSSSTAAPKSKKLSAARPAFC